MKAKRENDFFIENKKETIALHFRKNPTLSSVAQKIMEEALYLAGEDFSIQRGKMVLELKPKEITKGKALHHLMAQPPFHERCPISFGDDETDESMFCATRHYKGLPIKIAPNLKREESMFAHLYLPSPFHVRQWINKYIL